MGSIVNQSLQPTGYARSTGQNKLHFSGSTRILRSLGQPLDNYHALKQFPGFSVDNVFYERRISPGDENSPTIVSDLERHLRQGQNCFMFALGGSGKSSILEKVKQNLKEDYTIYEQIGLPPTEKGYEPFEAEFKAYMAEHPEPVVFVFHEAGHFFNMAGFLSPESVKKFKTLIAGYPNLVVLAESDPDYKADIPNSLLNYTVHLKPLVENKLEFLQALKQNITGAGFTGLDQPVLNKIAQIISQLNFEGARFYLPLLADAIDTYRRQTGYSGQDDFNEAEALPESLLLRVFQKIEEEKAATAVKTNIPASTAPALNPVLA